MRSDVAAYSPHARRRGRGARACRRRPPGVAVLRHVRGLLRRCSPGRWAPSRRRRPGSPARPAIHSTRLARRWPRGRRGARPAAREEAAPPRGSRREGAPGDGAPVAAGVGHHEARRVLRSARPSNTALGAIFELEEGRDVHGLGPSSLRSRRASLRGRAGGSGSGSARAGCAPGRAWWAVPSAPQKESPRPLSAAALRLHHRREPACPRAEHERALQHRLQVLARSRSPTRRSPSSTSNPNVPVSSIVLVMGRRQSRGGAARPPGEIRPSTPRRGWSRGPPRRSTRKGTEVWRAHARAHRGPARRDLGAHPVDLLEGVVEQLQRACHASTETS
jgi:hypothetical protein